MKNRLFTALITTLLVASSAHAYETDEVRGYSYPHFHSPEQINDSESGPRPKKALSDGERLRKFNLALDALNIPHEGNSDFSDYPADGIVAQPEVQGHLKFIDPDGGLRRYLQLTSEALSLFQDYFTPSSFTYFSRMFFPKMLVDYSVKLKQEGMSEDSRSLIAHLQTISEQVKNPRVQFPLTGMKFVIDPGHMGTPFWDLQTGKFVKVDGVKVSEGQLNLWTALLTANELEKLGAKVVLTRTEDGTVSSETLDNFNVAPHINQYFYNSIDDWMAPYLAKLSDSELSSTIQNKPEVRKAYSTEQRTQYFITGADLEARSAIIDRERPDVVLDIHFDAEKSNSLQSRDDSIEAFVPGAFRANETGSRRIRGFAVKHLLEIQRWNESVALASEITQSMSANLNLPLLKDQSMMTAVKIQDGVYARNLYINRRNLSALTVYLECLHYDHISEFSQLAQNTEVGNYHGTSFNYPPRLRLIASGIRAGLVNYMKK